MAGDSCRMTTSELRDAERDAERDDALAALFDRERPQLLRLAALLGAGQDAEDIVSDAFCQLYLRWPDLRDHDAAPGYLRAVVSNQVRMHLRHLQVVRRHQGLPSPAADAAESAETEALLREDQHAVVLALQRLPDRQRQALVLRYWLDLCEREVAESMGISAGAVKSHVFRGMAALTRQLAAAP
jgi:RNA polymerase sigma-70 factor (sigma-E family)